MGLKLTAKTIDSIDYDKVPMWAIAKVIYTGEKKHMFSSFLFEGAIVRKMLTREGFHVIACLSGKNAVLVQDKKSMIDDFKNYRFIVLPEGTQLYIHH